MSETLNRGAQMSVYANTTAIVIDNVSADHDAFVVLLQTGGAILNIFVPNRFPLRVEVRGVEKIRFPESAWNGVKNPESIKYELILPPVPGS